MRHEDVLLGSERGAARVAERIEGYFRAGSSMAGPVCFWLFSELSALRRRPDSVRAFKSESFGWIRWRGNWQRVTAGLQRPRLAWEGREESP